MRDNNKLKLMLKLVFLITCSAVIVFLFRALRNFIINDLFSGHYPSIANTTFCKKLMVLNFFINEHSNIEFFILFMFSFLWFANSYINYFIQIKNTILHIADGQADCRLPIKYNNELTQLAERVNLLINQLENKLKEVKLAEQTKNDLITNVSHDLRTPLTSIIGYIDLIKRGQYKDEAGLHYYIDIIHKKTNRLNRLISDLFEFVLTRNPQFRLAIQVLNLKELLKQLSADFNTQLKMKQMKIRTVFPEKPIFIKGEGDKLARAFENIITNAIKYGDTTRSIEIRVTEVSGMVHIKIINYGLPIPPDDLPYIFDRFYRVEKSRSEESGGSGLGLSISKNIIERHNGTITVESNENQTCFKIMMPTTGPF